MTIQFCCPNCNAVIAFHDKHCGKRARCTTCGQLFIIPSKDNETAKKYQPPKDKGEPLPGFYRAVFVDSWKLFVTAQNATGLVFVAAAVCFKFFAGHTDYSFTMGYFRVQAPTGFIITLSSWGCLFWYYMEIIQSTALDIEELPDVYMGGLFGFIWNIAKSLYLFALSLTVALVPCIISVAALGTDTIVSRALALVGLFIFPIAILTFSVGRDIWMIFRPGYLIKPVTQAFRPYTVAAGLLILAWVFQLKTLWYNDLSDRGSLVIGLHLCANLGVQIVAIIAMRSTGLFYRHFSCHFPW